MPKPKSFSCKLARVGKSTTTNKQQGCSHWALPRLCRLTLQTRPTWTFCSFLSYTLPHAPESKSPYHFTYLFSFDWAHCEFNSALLCLSLVSQLSKLQAAERLLVQCRDISSMNKNLAIALAYTWIKLGALQSDELRRNDYFGSASTLSSRTSSSLPRVLLTPRHFHYH